MVCYGDQISRLTVVYLSLLGSWDKLTAARPEHVALRTRYERRNTIEAGIKGWDQQGEAVRSLVHLLGYSFQVHKRWEIWSDPNVSICLLGRHLHMEDVPLLAMFVYLRLNKL